jgi:glycosyltransferase involved in cell wall biosynthesis
VNDAGRPAERRWYQDALLHAAERDEDHLTNQHQHFMDLLMSRLADGPVARPPARRTQLRPRVSVVVPALNEEPNLPYVLPKLGGWIHEVILVDGNSEDATCEVARAILPGIRIVQQQEKGKGAALRAGFEAAEGDIIVMLDADGSTDPSEIPVYVGALLAGADFVKGTRFAQGAGTADMSRLRQCGNRVFVYAVRVLFGGRCSDLCYGYMAFWKRVLPRLELDVNGFEIETQMSVRALGVGLKVAEVPSFEYRRLHGKSNLRTVPDGWRVLKTIMREWRLARRRRRAQKRHPELESGGVVAQRDFG